MARSTRKSVAIPNPVLDGVRLQLQRGTLEYPSENAALVGLARYQLMIGKPHPVTATISRFHLDDQDLIDDFLLELNQRGLSLGGQFLRHVAERAADSLPEPDPDVVTRLQADQILAIAKRWRSGEDVWEELDE